MKLTEEKQDELKEKLENYFKDLNNSNRISFRVAPILEDNQISWQDLTNPTEDFIKICEDYVKRKQKEIEKYGLLIDFQVNHTNNPFSGVYILFGIKGEILSVGWSHDFSDEQLDVIKQVYDEVSNDRKFIAKEIVKFYLGSFTANDYSAGSPDDCIVVVQYDGVKSYQNQELILDKIDDDIKTIDKNLYARSYKAWKSYSVTFIAINYKED